MKFKPLIYEINENLSHFERPVILIGDGIRQSGTIDDFLRLAKKIDIPVLSSRFAQDIIPGAKNFYGYIGSHGTRYSNRILYESDAIISIGNRLDFEPTSATFGSIAEKIKIRIDCDKNEFSDKLLNCKNFLYDLRETMPELVQNISSHSKKNWNNFCDGLKTELFASDISYPLTAITKILQNISKDSIIVSDVGNNELYLCRAYEYAQIKNRKIHSKSFGTVGSSLPKAIGAYYAENVPVICFSGDQGLMFNSQELQFIRANKLPISVILINNQSSNMIKDEQMRRKMNFIHSTIESGYSVPNFEKVVRAYGLIHYMYEDRTDFSDILKLGMVMIEVFVDHDEYKNPYLPKGNKCWEFVTK
jgi:acetolactate synthase-1/2/3 large subunit